MERIFLKDVGKNFKAGERRDYPHDTWVGIARAAGRSLEKITKQVDEFAHDAVTRKGG